MDTGSPPTTRLLRLGPDDNVLIAAAPIPAGTRFVVDEVECTALGEIPTGFKVAAHDLRPGERIVRCGVVVGEATAEVARGSLVHTHNVRSRYLRTHRRGEP